MVNDINQISTLEKFGNEFQSKCVACCLSNKLFLERIFDILQPEYFTSSSNNYIISTIIKYYLEYKDIPTLQVFSIKSNEIQNEVLKTSVVEQLKNVYRNYINSTDLKFVSEQFLDFCKNQKMKNAIISSTDYLKMGEYDKIRSVVDDALKAGMERNLGHEYIVDVDKRMSEMARHTIKTGWPIIDQLLDGGLAKGELGFVISSAGGGKSWFLTRIGAEAMKQGKNVVHITLELNENYVGLRYDSCFTGITFQDVRKNVDKVKQQIDKVSGKLFIKYFPIKTIAPYNIKMYIDRLQMLTGYKIDLLIVDYADLLRPQAAEKNANSYSEAGSVYEELRGIAGELSVPCWSASQGQRASSQQDIIQAHNVADSYRKIMTGDFVIGASRRMEDKELGTARFSIIKNRFGADGLNFPSYFNASNGDIQIFDPNTSEGMKCLEKIKQGKDNMQDLVEDNWNDIKKNKKSSSFED